jgi:hypothetical protein
MVQEVGGRRGMRRLLEPTGEALDRRLLGRDRRAAQEIGLFDKRRDRCFGAGRSVLGSGRGE